MTKRTYDNLLLLKDAGAQTATGPATVASVARVLDMGPASMGAVSAVVDVSAITGTGTYRVAVQGSADVGFTTPVELGSTDITLAGRTEIPFSNVKGATTYRYVRAFITTGGTSPSLNATIFIAKG